MKTMAEGKQYFTVKDVFDATVKLAKADPYFEQYNKICVLDYDLILRDCEDGTLYRAEFGVLGDVSYGESEGIYGDIYLYGSWSKDQNDFRRNRARVYVLKTLNCDKESYLAIGMLVNLICYYANEFITDWIGCIAEWLSKLGYHLDGKMFAVVEGGMSFYTITVDGDKVTSEEFIPDATYVDEFYACEESEDT